MTLPARALATAATRPCPRLDAAATHGWGDTATAAHHGYTGKSPRLAYAYGKAYEDRITRDTDRLARLLDADPGQAHTCTAEHGDADSHHDFITRLNDPETTLILQGVIPGPYGGWLRPDLLYKRNGEWTVGEIKIYLDKGGETDGHAFGSAVTQAAIATDYLRRNNHPVTSTVTVILTNLIGAPVIRTVDATGEMAMLDHLKHRAPYQGETPEPPDLAHIQDIYSLRCHGKCALADYCRDIAENNGAQFPTMDLTTRTATTSTDLKHLAHTDTTTINAGYTAAQPVTLKGTDS